MMLYFLRDKNTKLFVRYYIANGEPHIRYVDSLREATIGKDDKIIKIMESIRNALYNRTNGNEIPTPKPNAEQREQLENIEASTLITPLQYEKLLNKTIRYNRNQYGVILDIVEGYNDIWIIAHNGTMNHRELVALSEIDTIAEIDLYDFLLAK